MKIAYLIWDYWPGLQGGAERQARLISQEVARRGGAVEVITARQSYSSPVFDQDGDVRIRRIGLFIPIFLCLKHYSAWLTKWLFSLVGGHRFAECTFWVELPMVWFARFEFMVVFLFHCWRRKLAVDIVHLHEPSWLGGVAQIGAGIQGFEVICQEATSPALPEIGYDTPFRLTLDRARRLPRYIAMADYLKQELLQKGIPLDRIDILPSGVPVPEHSSEGMVDGHVLHVANYSQGAAWKAFDVLYEAWILVAKRRPGVRLHAVGGGDHSVWKAQVTAAGHGESVHFTGTVLSVEPYFAKSAIFVLPSRVEGMSNALLEAQMWGLACVVSDIPGNRAVVKDGYNGLIVPVGDVTALANAIITLLDDEALRSGLGKAAREYAVREFGIESVGPRLLNIYEKVLKGS